MYIDCPVEEAFRRTQEREGKSSFDFAQQQNAYRIYAEEIDIYENPIARIDGNLPPDEVFTQVVSSLKNLNVIS